jgi:glycine/D-amino acid oxidase-like deaminating enzyme
MAAGPSDRVLVVGAGIVGLTTAWQLAERGHRVQLIDPLLRPNASQGAAAGSPRGSEAALGVLMGHVFQRTSGRAWRYRLLSLKLWSRWLTDLERRGYTLPRRRGLLLLAHDARDQVRQEQLARERERQGISLRWLAPEELDRLHPALPEQPLGGLLSPEDGQIDPGPLLEALATEAGRKGVVAVATRAMAVERGHEQRWRLLLESGSRLEADWLVLALGLGTEALLASLGHALRLQPVLGQALELELAEDPGWNWPGAVVWRGMNLVPRPDLSGGRRLWLGATLEPGETASPTALDSLRTLGGDAPGWLKRATVIRQWQGWRCRPADRPAPVLEEAEPGLLITSGHYRNGVLLAPASAAWVCERIEADPRQLAD